MEHTRLAPQLRDSQKRPPTMLVLDPRRYRRHRGHFLHADRVLIGGMWTPLVRVRARVPRACDGATEI
jgi:hypothetical protein